MKCLPILGTQEPLELECVAARVTAEEPLDREVAPAALTRSLQPERSSTTMVTSTALVGCGRR